MMKQKFKNTIRRMMVVPSIILGLLCVVSVATAQKTTTPPKQTPDIMLSKHNANEVIQRALAEWGSEMLAADPSSPDYDKLSNRFTLLFTVNTLVQERNKNVSGCIEEAGRLVLSEKIITDNTAYESAINEVRLLLLKTNNPNYKE